MSQIYVILMCFIKNACDVKITCILDTYQFNLFDFRKFLKLNFKIKKKKKKGHPYHLAFNLFTIVLVRFAHASAILLTEKDIYSGLQIFYASTSVK